MEKAISEVKLMAGVLYVFNMVSAPYNLFEFLRHSLTDERTEATIEHTVEHLTTGLLALALIAIFYKAGWYLAGELNKWAKGQ